MSPPEREEGGCTSPARDLEWMAAAYSHPEQVKGPPPPGAVSPVAGRAIEAIRDKGQAKGVLTDAGLSVQMSTKVIDLAGKGTRPYAELLASTPVRLSLADAQHPPSEDFVIGNMIPFAKSSVLFGPQSVGKSAAAAQLAFAFAAGEPTLWGLPIYQGGGPVLIYTAEDSLDDWKRKAAALMRAGGIDVQRALDRIFIIDKSEGVARLSEVVTVRFGDTTRRVAQPTEEQDRMIVAARNIGARLILVETASRLVEDEDNANMSALQSSLGRVARETGAATLTTHHPTKAASKDNDSAIESARGGGAFTMNARNVVSLFPADAEVANQYADRFPADDLVVLAHGKPSSSTRRHSPILLVRTDAVFGAVFRLPGEVAYTPEQTQRNNERLEQARTQEWEQLRRLYTVVAELLVLGSVSTNKLEQTHNREKLALPKARVSGLVRLAVERGVLRIATRNARGTTLALGTDPSRPVNGDPAPTPGEP